jgi:hypothetical protein
VTNNNLKINLENYNSYLDNFVYKINHSLLNLHFNQKVLCFFLYGEEIFVVPIV